VPRGGKNKNKNASAPPPPARRGLNEILGALGAMSATDPTVVPRSYAALAVCTPGGGLLGKHHGDAALRSAWVAGTVPPPAVDLDAALRGEISRDGEGGPAGTDAWDERLGAGTPSVVGDFDFDFDCDVSENASTSRDEGSSARGGSIPRRRSLEKPAVFFGREGHERGRDRGGAVGRFARRRGHGAFGRGGRDS
jgi:hypothetical protein